MPASVVVTLLVEFGREANRLAHSSLAFVCRCASALLRSPVVVLSVSLSVCRVGRGSLSMFWFVTFLVTLIVIPGCTIV